MSYQTPPPPQQYPPAQQPYGPPPQQPPGYGPPPQYQHYGAEPPEATSIKSMLNIAGLLGLVFGLLFILVAVWQIIAFLTWTWFFLTGALIIAIYFIIAGIINFLLFMQCKNISGMVDQRQYEQAKSNTLLWIILGFIFAGIITAILLIIAYLKFDSLIRWGQPGQYPPGTQPYYQPQPQYPQPQPYPLNPPPYQPPPPYP